jgi:hypothetical protein
VRGAQQLDSFRMGGEDAVWRGHAPPRHFGPEFFLGHEFPLVTVPKSEASRLSAPRCRMDLTNTGGKHMRVVWIEQAGLSAGAGHGVDFGSDDPSTGGELLAVVRGFLWCQERPGEIEVFIRPPDETFAAEFLAEAKRAIEQFLKQHKVVPPGWISEKVYQYPNC